MNAAMPRSAVGRADLARLLAALPPARVANAAITLGFDPPPDPEISITWVDDDESAQPSKNAPSGPTISDKPEPTSIADLRLPLWRMETVVFHDEADAADSRLAQQGLTEDDWTSPSKSVLASRRTTPLAPWSRLWPRLKKALQNETPTRDVNIDAYVHDVCRGVMSSSIPRLTRPTWPARMSIWLDRSARLIPFWEDESFVAEKLQKLCGQSNVRLRILEPSIQSRSLAARGDLLAGVRLDLTEPVLILGDLGVYGTDVDREVWQRTGHRLRSREIRLSALVPTSRKRLSSSMAHVWQANPWEQNRQGVGLSGASSGGDLLLTMCAAAAHIEPGLLRDLRLLLPKDLVDASMEADVWNHEDVGSASSTAMMLNEAALARRRETFAQDPALAPYREKVSAMIQVWHENLPLEVSHAEALTWHEMVPSVKPPGDVQEALAFAQRLEGSLLAAGEESADAWALSRFGQALLTGMPEGIYKKVPALRTLWVASFTGKAAPEGVDPTAIRKQLERAGQTRTWALRQIGNVMKFFPNDRGAAWPSHVRDLGSPVALLVAARPWVTIVRGSRMEEVRLEPGLTLDLVSDELLELRTDRCTLTLQTFVFQDEPDWVGAGRDRFGLWAEAKFAGVKHRFRWIPPGKFLMGSPENEAGRHDNEGPQHWVTWTNGRWLGETPVTQGLWKAATGNNPSFFQSAKQSTDDRPVENVSWEEGMAFASKLGGRLPTEAEWEYACRAGTNTATWAGDLDVLGDNNAPLLDAIAWYGGNCGVKYDLDQWYDTTDWPDKQHAFARGGTRVVGKKDPNPFGLYDMLGNVYAWCRDVDGPYASKAVVDPDQVEDVENRYAIRVMRGGSWGSRAWGMRAARRNAPPPDYREDGIGFRLARDANSKPATKGKR